MVSAVLVALPTAIVVGAPQAVAGAAHSTADTPPTYVWPEFHGNAALNGVSADPTISASNASTLGVRWMAPVGASLDSPAVDWNAPDQQTLAYEGGKAGYFNAVDVETGQIVWSDYLGSSITSSPLIENGNVWIAPVGVGRLYKLNGATGAIECSGTVTDSVLSSPVYADPPGGVPTVYLASLGGGATNGPVAAYNESDCSQSWKWSNYVISGQDSGVWSPLSYAVNADGTGLLLFGSANPDSEVYALNAVTGALVWRYATYSPSSEDWDVGAGVSTSAPGVNGFADGMAYVDGKDGILFGLDLTTGALVWQFNFGGNSPTNPVATGTDALTTPALSGTTLVFGDITGLYAVNAVTGAEEWFTQGTGDINSSPVIVGPAGAQVVAYGDLNGNFHVAQLSTGKILYTYQTGNFITSSVADVDGNLLVNSDDGFLYDFDLGGGNATVPTTAITSPVSGANLANPNGSLVISGSATAPDGVQAVDVQIQSSGASGPWFNQSTGTFTTGMSTALATLAAPGATSTTWTLSVPIPAQGGTYSVYSSAVDADGIADNSAYSASPGSSEESFSVGVSSSSPQIVATPARVAPLGTTSITATGFQPGETVTFTVPVTTGGSDTIATATATAAGSVSATSATLPAATAFGADPITGTGSVSGKTGSGSVYVSNDDPQYGYGPAHTGTESNDTVIEKYQAVSTSNKLAQGWSVAGQGAFDTTPAFSQGVAYVGDESGNLYAVEMTSGLPLFTASVGSPVESSPAVDGGQVIVGDDAGTLKSFNATTGVAGWSTKIGGKLTSPAVSGGFVYVGSTNGHVTAVRESTGKIVWTDSGNGEVLSVPAVNPTSGTVAVTTHKGVVMVLNGATGAVVWTHSVTGVLTSGMISSGNLYVGSSNGSVYAFNESTGAALWSAATGSAVAAAPIIAYDDVTVGNAAGAVSYYNQASGKKINTQSFFAHPITGITSTQGIILLTSSWGLGMIEGPKYVRMTWLQPNTSGYAAPGVFLNGDMFVAGLDGVIRGYTTPGRPIA
jgi:outer membrane protein assembly factor BamB